MRRGLQLNTVILMVLLSTQGTSAQIEERTPSGDLSNFFNPPGVKTEGIRSTTRKIGPDKDHPKSTSPPASSTKAKPTKNTTADAKDTKPEMPSSTAESKPAGNSAADDVAIPQPKQPARKSRSAAGNADSRVKLENKELAAVEGGISFGRPTETNWRVGVVMATGSKPVRNVTCRIPVPIQWPEQQVSVYEENLPSEITDVSWEDLGNIRLMNFRIGNVPAGEKLIGTVTFSVSTSQIIAPKNTAIFRIPKKRTREIKPYFSESPEIGLRNTKLKKQAKLLFDNDQSTWIKVEGIYDWIRDNIEERAGEPKGSVDTFLNKSGTGEDRVSLFVAMCRINKIPARMVFVDGSQYAEFYLVDDKEQGHWFPAQVTGIREFGSMSEPRVILQKGDNYKVPGEKKKLKFVPAKASVKGTPPRILRFAREPLSVK